MYEDSKVNRHESNTGIYLTTYTDIHTDIEHRLIILQDIQTLTDMHHVYMTIDDMCGTEDGGR